MCVGCDLCRLATAREGGGGVKESEGRTWGAHRDEVATRREGPQALSRNNRRKARTDGPGAMIDAAFGCGNPLERNGRIREARFGLRGGRIEKVALFFGHAATSKYGLRSLVHPPEAALVEASRRNQARHRARPLRGRCHRGIAVCVWIFLLRGAGGGERLPVLARGIAPSVAPAVQFAKAR